MNGLPYPAGFYIEEAFQFDGKWYGVLRSEDKEEFKRYVEITHFYPGGCNWMSINDTLENAVKYFHEKNKIDIKKKK